MIGTPAAARPVGARPDHLEADRPVRRDRRVTMADATRMSTRFAAAGTARSPCGVPHAPEDGEEAEAEPSPESGARCACRRGRVDVEGSGASRGPPGPVGSPDGRAVSG
jgi:hypothetical protein